MSGVKFFWLLILFATIPIVYLNMPAHSDPPDEEDVPWFSMNNVSLIPDFVILPALCQPHVLANYNSSKAVPDKTLYSTCTRTASWDNKASLLRPVPPGEVAPTTAPMDSERGRHLLDCRPCVGTAYHSAVAGSRRVFHFRRAMNGSRKVVDHAYVCLNWDAVLFHPAHLPSYEKTNLSFIINEKRKTVGAVFYPAPAIAYVYHVRGLGLYYTFFGTLAFESPWEAEVRSLVRSLQIMYKTKIAVCTRPDSCQEICPSTYFPYLACDGRTTSAPGWHDFKKFPKYTNSILKVDVHSRKPKPTNAVIGICLAGLIRNIAVTIPTLRMNVIDHAASSDVFISTWNLVGQVAKNSIQYSKGDRYVDALVIETDLRKLLGPHYVKSTIVVHADTKLFYNAMEIYQFYYHSRIHLHIRNSMQLLIDHGKRYDAVIVTRPDVNWFMPVHFVPRNNTSLDVVQYSETKDKILQKYTTELLDGDVGVHVTDSLMWDSEWSAGDWVHIGTQRTMERWVELYNYSTWNYITQGGGISHASFMRSVGQRWVVVDFSIALLRSQCTSKRHAMQFSRTGLHYNTEGKCFWVSKLKF